MGSNDGEHDPDPWRDVKFDFEWLWLFNCDGLGGWVQFGKFSETWNGIVLSAGRKWCWRRWRWGGGKLSKSGVKWVDEMELKEQHDKMMGMGWDLSKDRGSDPINSTPVITSLKLEMGNELMLMMMMRMPCRSVFICTPFLPFSQSGTKWNTALFPVALSFYWLDCIALEV